MSSRARASSSTARPSPPNTSSTSSAAQQQQQPWEHQPQMRPVSTIPAWARSLPPELPSDFDSTPSSDSASSDRPRASSSARFSARAAAKEHAFGPDVYKRTASSTGGNNSGVNSPHRSAAAVARQRLESGATASTSNGAASPAAPTPPPDAQTTPPTQTQPQARKKKGKKSKKRSGETEMLDKQTRAAGLGGIEPGLALDQARHAAEPSSSSSSDSSSDSEDGSTSGDSSDGDDGAAADRARAAQTGGGVPGAPTAPSANWWTFTIPSKYLAKVSDYVTNSYAPSSSSSDGDGDGEERVSARRASEDIESAAAERERRKRDVSEAYKAMIERDAQIQQPAPTVLSVNQAHTPGWNSPWQPFEGGLFGGPGTTTRSSGDMDEKHRGRARGASVSRKRRRQNRSGGVSPAVLSSRARRMAKLEQFVLVSPWAPLVFRIANTAVSACTLALAARLLVLQGDADADGVVGMSPLLAVVFAPLTLVHVFVNMYLELFGRPIGIWRMGPKMAHTLLELVFICMWSATLSLSFDDLFTSSLACTAYTPYAKYNERSGELDIDPERQDIMCRYQRALVSFVFVSVLLYVAVLVVSLFRIFHKVGRKG